MKSFDLKEYIGQINAIAEHNEVGVADAVEYFIINLTTMSDHYKGAPDLNFRALGQQWNSLSYKIRNKQRSEILDYLLVTKTRRSAK